MVVKYLDQRAAGGGGSGGLVEYAYFEAGADVADIDTNDTYDVPIFTVPVIQQGQIISKTNNTTIEFLKTGLYKIAYNLLMEYVIAGPTQIKELAYDSFFINSSKSPKRLDAYNWSWSGQSSSLGESIGIGGFSEFISNIAAIDGVTNTIQLSKVVQISTSPLNLLGDSTSIFIERLGDSI